MWKWPQSSGLLISEIVESLFYTTCSFSLVVGVLRLVLSGSSNSDEELGGSLGPLFLLVLLFFVR